ncbi:hypothetical protein D770_05285 [Flammeovirgaceae bacterium 311]|nr:hypothetical protein D770_05285 [Flammeovirgaceae bacterium 311]
MKQPLINFILLGLIITGCQTKNTDTVSNSTRVQFQGDSMKIETEVKGDLTIKRITDLHGIAEDGFDNSYEVHLRYREKINNKSVASDFNFILKGYKFSFDRSQATDFINKKIDELTAANEIPPIIEEYEQLRSIAKAEKDIHSFSQQKQEHWIADLLTYGEYSIENINSQDQPKSVLVEFYDISFAGGRDFYLITNKSDTIILFSHNDWQK